MQTDLSGYGYITVIIDCLIKMKSK